MLLLFLEHHRVLVVQHAIFSDWFVSLSNMHLSFFLVFYDLIVHLFLALKTISFSGHITVYWPIHLLTNILGTSKVRQL